MTATTTEEKSSTSQSKASDKTVEKLEKEGKASFGPPKIQTAEDAREAYLRGEISLDEFNAVRARYGLTNQQVFIPSNRLERGDEVFQNKLPDDYFQEPSTEITDFDTRVEEVEKKEANRQAARDAADKVAQDAKPEVDLATLQNQAAAKAVEDKNS